MNYVKKRLGFSFLEAVVALGIFTAVIVGGNALLHYLGGGVADMQNILKSQMLARNALVLTENVIKNDAVWKGSLGGSPASSYYSFVWNGSEYTLTGITDDAFEGPIDAYSLAESSSDRAQFYRRIHIEELESWGLYQVESEVCFDTCEESTKIYKVVEAR